MFSAASRDGSAYAERCGRAVAVMEEDERNGADPIEVARLLEKLIVAPAPRARYAVGMWIQKLGARLKPFLPDRLFDRAIRGIYKI